MVGFTRHPEAEGDRLAWVLEIGALESEWIDGHAHGQDVETRLDGKARELGRAVGVVNIPRLRGIRGEEFGAGGKQVKDRDDKYRGESNPVLLKSLKCQLSGGPPS